MTRIATSTIYATLALMLAQSGLDQTVLSAALPTIVQSLHGQSLAAWVVSTYVMASTAVIPLYGDQGDRGRAAASRELRFFDGCCMCNMQRRFHRIPFITTIPREKP